MQKESELIGKAKKGNKSALEKLYTENFKGLYTYVRHKVDHDYRAEDIVSESFIKAFENIKKFKGESSFKTWIYTIARNKIIDWYRTRGNEISLNEELIEGKANTYLSSQSEKQIRLIFSKLKQSYREVLELRFLSNLNVSETAEVLKIKENNVKVLQHRAIDAARKIADKFELIKK